MTDLLLRNLEPDLKRRIAAEARRHNLSLSEGAKLLIQRGLTADDADQYGFASRLRAAIPSHGFADLELPPRDPGREPPDFS